jgi:hypothetical protein
MDIRKFLLKSVKNADEYIGELKDEYSNAKGSFMNTDGSAVNSVEQPLVSITSKSDTHTEY